uniref:DUF4055 domain-containing protein n=1 Tax=viral metagenome TaxID=1070528 RepID=A0A6M3J8B0_9ZZZZ
MATTNDTTAGTDPNRDVDVPIDAHRETEEQFSLVETLLGGTAAMRAAGERYLPRFWGEELTDYGFRLSNSFLNEMFSDTVRKLSAKPFSRPVSIQGNPPASLSGLEEDADLAGQSLTDFMQRDFESCVALGKSTILVDLPTLSGRETVGELRRTGVRPYLVHVPATALIGWRVERRRNGALVPTQIRWREYVDVPDSRFGSRSTYKVRVYDAPRYDEETGEVVEKGRWSVYTRVQDRWVVEMEGYYSAPRIPAVTWYTRRTGYLRSRPALEGLAYKNLEHWASSSDQRNILHFARTGTMTATGLDDEEYDRLGAEVAIGMNQFLRSRNENASFGVVEHSGKATEAGENDLKRIEDQAEKLGDQPMVEQARDTTATAVRTRSGERMTLLQSWIHRQEAAYLALYRFAAEIMGEEIPDDFRIDVFSDFAALAGASSDLEQILKLRAAGDLTRQSTLVEFRRRGILSETLDVEEEDAAVEEENAGRGTATGSQKAPEDEEEDDEDEDEDGLPADAGNGTADDLTGEV